MAVEKHLDACQFYPTPFFFCTLFKIPTVEVVVRSMWLSLCFACLLFPPLPCLSPSARLSCGDMLELIITIASGFIRIYSHNNTEKGADRQDWCDVLSSTGIIFHNDIQQSFLSPPLFFLYSSLSFSFLYSHTYTFSSFLTPFLPLPSVHSLLSQNP